jgi:hypothetical protein
MHSQRFFNQKITIQAVSFVQGKSQVGDVLGGTSSGSAHGSFWGQQGTPFFRLLFEDRETRKM